MNLESYFYNCSRAEIDSISPDLYGQIAEGITRLSGGKTKSEIIAHLFWWLIFNRWHYDISIPGVTQAPDWIGLSLDEIKKRNNSSLCMTATTLNIRWKADYAKQFESGLVQIEAQFGKSEAVCKDFCGFQLAFAEQRLAVGIEIVMSDPKNYFRHRERAYSGMAYFKIARDTLNMVRLDCPIWLIGIC